MIHRHLPRFALLGWMLGSFALQAQFSPSLRLDYSQATHRDHDFNDFFRSYNAYYGGNMAIPFDTLAGNTFSHPNWGFGLRFMTPGKVGFHFCFVQTFGRKQHNMLAEFQNGIQTAVDFDVRDISSQVELGFSLGQALHIYGIMAGYFRRTVVDIGYIYQDGTYSLGNEYDILSVHSASTSSLDFGLGAGLRLGRFYFPVGITFPNNLISDDGLLTFLDYDERQIRWSDIPRDFRAWADDPANIDLDNGFVRAESLRSMRLTFGIEFLLVNPAKN